MLRSSLHFVTNHWRNKCFFQLNHCTHAVRFLGTHQLDSNDYIQALYNKLSTKDPYQFLDQNIENNEVLKVDENLSSSPEFKDFLNIIAKCDASEVSNSEMSGIQKFSEKFQDWTRVSQLRVGFLMHLDKRINSSEYLTKVIRHMSSVNPFDAGPHDLTALLLLIYFKRDLSVEYLSEYLDLGALQTALALNIDNKKMTPEEICAVCLGLKRIADMKVNLPMLRKSLYTQLRMFQAKDDPLDDFFVITLLTTLSKGNLVFMDHVDLVRDMLFNFENEVSHLNLDTTIKLLTFPLTLGFSNETIETFVFNKVKSDLERLEPWDLVQLCNYISKQSRQFAVTDDLLELLETKLDNLNNLDELMDIIECFHYLSHISVYSQKFNSVLFEAVNLLPEDYFKQDSDFSAITKDVSLHIMERFGIRDVLMEREKVFERNSNKTISVFTRIPAFISTSYRIESNDHHNLIESYRADFISKGDHRRLPMELYVPQMDIKTLDRRSKQLINCFRALVRFMGNEQYVGVTRILPHFTEPDIVFGNIGGNCLTIPTYLTDPDFVGFRKAPPGDWWVIVVGTRKSHDLRGNIIGQEAAKLRQLKTLGYTPIVIPYTDLGAFGTVTKSLSRLLKTENVSLPNLDDGIRERKRKF